MQEVLHMYMAYPHVCLVRSLVSLDRVLGSPSTAAWRGHTNEMAGHAWSERPPQTDRLAAGSVQ